MSFHRPFVIATLSLVLVACQTSSNEGAPAPSSNASTVVSVAVGALQLVDDRSKVCMVNNQYMGKPQIPTTVAGKTYYGCCAMCKEKLENNASARTAIDPVTNNVVDKASAVIGRDETSKVYYFESEASMSRYHAGS